MEIRLLRADEIECRVSTVKKNGCSLLLYKDARCDMNILDEVFGPMGWQRSHQTINNNLFCTVSVYDEERQIWISKQDVGTESYAEKEKGQASDSFKRACFNIGIGRELYTAPFIWVNLGPSEVKEVSKDKYTTYTHFKVTYISYEGRKINGLEIIDDKGNVRFSLNAPNQPKTSQTNRPKEQTTEEQTTPTEPPQEQPKHLATGKKLTDRQVKRLYDIATKKGYAEEQVKNGVLKRYHVEDIHDLNRQQYDEICKGYENAAPKAAQ